MRVQTLRLMAVVATGVLEAAGCSSPVVARHREEMRLSLVADDTVVNAFDARLESRLVDRIELDHFLRDRDIHIRVNDGRVTIRGVVWTPLERERVGGLVGGVGGVVDVANELNVAPPK
jgi:osmotically-inducible protein OsmY